MPPPTLRQRPRSEISARPRQWRLYRLARARLPDDVRGARPIHQMLELFSRECADAFFVQVGSNDRGFIGEFSLIATPGWLIRRELLDQAGAFDERMRCWDDWELAYRLSKITRFAHLPEPLLLQECRRPARDAMWDGTKNFANDYRVIVEKHGKDWPNVRDVARHFYLIGRFGLDTSASADSRQWLRRATQLHRTNYRAWALQALLCLGPGFARSAIAGFSSLKLMLQPGRQKW